jgi:hypothetical protein
MHNYKMWYTEMNIEAVRKWAENKWNEGVLGWANNEALVIGPTHERRRVCITSEGTCTRSEVNSCSCSWSIKEDCSNKHLQNWTYEIYLCQENTCHKTWKIINILQN